MEKRRGLHLEEELHGLTGCGEKGVAAEGRVGVVGEVGLGHGEGCCYRGGDGPPGLQEVEQCVVSVGSEEVWSLVEEALLCQKKNGLCGHLGHGRWPSLLNSNPHTCRE